MPGRRASVFGVPREIAPANTADPPEENAEALRHGKLTVDPGACHKTLMSDTHHLHIGGQRLTVRSPMEPDRVQALAAMVDRRVRDAARGGVGNQGATLMAALGLADELNRLKAEMKALRETIALEALSLADSLEDMAADRPPPEGFTAVVEP